MKIGSFGCKYDFGYSVNLKIPQPKKRFSVEFSVIAFPCSTLEKSSKCTSKPLISSSTSLFKYHLLKTVAYLSLKSPKPTVEIVVVAKYQDSKKSRFSSVEMIAAGMSVVSEYTIIRRPNTEICLIEIKNHE